MSSLVSGADVMSSVVFTPDVPPVFMLDSQRLMGLLPPMPGTYDNRWVVFPQNFPSGTFLRSRQTGQVLISQITDSVDDDLAHLFSGWQQAGIKFSMWKPTDAKVPAPLTVLLPSRMGFGIERLCS